MSKLTPAALRRFLKARKTQVFDCVPDKCPVAEFLRAGGAPSPYADFTWTARDLPFTNTAHLTYRGPKTKLPPWAVLFVRHVAESDDITGAAALAILDSVEKE